jgi:hypothetical protein
MEQKAFTEEQGTLFGHPLTNVDDECIVDDAAQRARAVAAVLTAAAGGRDAENVPGGSRVG